MYSFSFRRNVKRSIEEIINPERISVLANSIREAEEKVINFPDLYKPEQFYLIAFDEIDLKGE